MDFLHRVLYTAVGAFSIFCFFVKVSLSHWKKRGVLHDKPKFMWGNLKGVGSTYHITEVLNEIYTKFKGKAPFIGFYAWLKPLILVLDVDLARRILITDANSFTQRGFYSNVQDEPLTDNLIQLDRCAYERLYYKASPYFAQVMTLLPTLLSVAETFRRSLTKMHSKCGTVNILELIAAYNTDAVSMIAFGLKSDTLLFPTTEFRCMSRSYLNKIGLFKIYMAWSFPNIARMFNFKMYNDTASAYFIELVQKQIEERKSLISADSKPTCFLDFFVENHQTNDHRSTERIAAQCFSFLLAGLEASNSTLTFCLYELSVHTSIQEKAREEIMKTLSKHEDKLTAECINDMVYLKQILYETLRMHSPYPFLLRNTKKDYEVPDSVLMLQEGNSIIIPVSSFHHDPSIYPNPENFEPSRFDPDSPNLNSAAFLPFGCGPRACSTRDLAELQMLVFLVTVLRQYRFTCSPNTNILMQYDRKKLIVTPKNQIRLWIENV